jgi:hypothetical protein
MHKHLTLVLATLALSAAAFAQSDYYYQVGYAANLNIGDSELNISNDGFRFGFYNNNTTGNGAGNICVNVFTFDPSEEEISCCSCLVTPNALVSLSAKNDLINNVLTPAIPTSIVVKLTATVPGTSTGTVYNVCNPTITETVSAASLNTADPTPYDLTQGMLAWGATLEPSSPAGTYSPVAVPYLRSNLSTSEQGDLTSVCSFVRQEGTGFGVCGSCALGALSGTKN